MTPRQKKAITSDDCNDWPKFQQLKRCMSSIRKSHKLHHDTKVEVMTAEEFVRQVYPHATVVASQGHKEHILYWIVTTNDNYGEYISPGVVTKEMAWAYAKTYINTVMMNTLEK